MKTLRYVFSGVILLLIMLSSCVKESAIVGDEGQPVQITFRTGTRSGDPEPGEGDPADRYINSLRVLGYRVSDGTLAFNEPVYGFDPQVTGREKYTGEIKVLTGKFTVIFIANELSDNAVHNSLKSLALNTATLSDFKGMSFSISAFSSIRDIPMVTIKENIIIQGNNKLIDNSIQPEPITTAWPVSMERLGVRVDLEVTLAEGQTADETHGLIISNIPDEVFLIPKSNGGTFENSRRYDLPPTTSVEGGKTKMIWERIILPECMFSDSGNSIKGMTIKLKVNDVPRSAVIGVDLNPVNDSDPKNYTLPRNTYLDITGTVSGPTTKDINFSVTVIDWENPGMASETEIF